MADKTLYPNTFQHHNAYIDRISFFLTGNEEKVLNHVIREIIGFQDNAITRQASIALSILVNGKISRKTGDRLSWGCGLKDNAVRKALQKLCEFGLLAKVGEPTQDGQCYELQLDWNKIAWKKMEERKAAQDESYRQILATARQNIGVLSNSTPTIEQEGGGTIQQEGGGTIEQYPKNPVPNSSLNPSVACQKQQATCPPTPSDLEQGESAQESLPPVETVQPEAPPVAISAECQEEVAQLFAPDPPHRPKPAPPAGPNKNAVRAQLEAHFVEKTGLPAPKTTTAKYRKAAGSLWWSPLREIAELCEWDAARAEKLICLTVDHLRAGKMTVANPNSIVKTAQAIYTGNVPGVKMPHEKKLEKIQYIDPLTGKLVTEEVLI